MLVANPAAILCRFGNDNATFRDIRKRLWPLLAMNLRPLIRRQGGRNFSHGLSPRFSASILSSRNRSVIHLSPLAINRPSS
jgi:hypothetical protein